MKKHAYLVMIHEDNDILKKLLNLLDDPRNDIFIHIDKKAKNINLTNIKTLTKFSTIYFTKRHTINWGTNSMAVCQLSMLKQASKQHYTYYHLISGADFPLKTQNEIHTFFDENDSKEFIHFGTPEYQRGIASRFDTYHFFMKQLGRNRENPFWVQLETYSLAIQRRLKINRTNHHRFEYFGGAQWFSISHQFATYLVENFKRYYKYFIFTQNCDEYFMQTMIMDSPFKNNLYMSEMNDNYLACMRYIDWSRGNPYTFKLEDFDSLIHSDCCFARKFNEKEDSKIIEKLYLYLKSNP